VGLARWSPPHSRATHEARYDRADLIGEVAPPRVTLPYPGVAGREGLRRRPPTGLWSGGTGKVVASPLKGHPRSHVEFVPSLELRDEKVVFFGLMERGQIRCWALKSGTLLHDDLIP